MSLALFILLGALIGIDIFFGTRQPDWFRSLRMIAALLWAGLVIALIVFTRNGVISLLVGVLAAMPVVAISWGVTEDRLGSRLLLIGGQFGIAVLFVGLASTLPGVLMHGDNHPFLLVAVGLLAGAAMAVIVPPSAPRIPVWPIYVPGAVLVVLWIGALVWVQLEMDKIYTRDEACLAEPGGRQLRSPWALSPRAVLFDTDFRSGTRARLLLGRDGHPWTHHLSLREGTFLPNKSQAFAFMAPRMANCRP